jgi:hypothetical protein
VGDLLPGTPRAIKAIARDVALMKTEIDRRASTELSWPSLLLGMMMKAESQEFFHEYRREVFGDPHVKDLTKPGTGRTSTSVADLCKRLHIDDDGRLIGSTSLPGR